MASEIELWYSANTVLNRLFHSLDTRDYQLATNCFATAGCWYRQGKALVGDDAIARVLATRAAKLQTLHVVSNVTSLSDRDFAFYLTVYRHDGEEGTAMQMSPADAASFAGMSRLSLVQERSAWKIGSLTTGPYLFVKI